MNPQIEGARQAAQGARDRLLHALAAVPDDKLDWSPGPNARSALAVAAHCAVSYGAFAMILRGQPLPVTTPEQIRDYAEAEERKLTTREAVVAAIQSGSDQVDAALAELPEDRIGMMVKMPMMEAPMSFFMALPAIHLQNHVGQIDYLQRFWGDMEMHL